MRSCAAGERLKYAQVSPRCVDAPMAVIGAALHTALSSRARCSAGSLFTMRGIRLEAVSTMRRALIGGRTRQRRTVPHLRNACDAVAAADAADENPPPRWSISVPAFTPQVRLRSDSRRNSAWRRCA